MKPQLYIGFYEGVKIPFRDAPKTLPDKLEYIGFIDVTDPPWVSTANIYQRRRIGALPYGKSSPGGNRKEASYTCRGQFECRFNLLSGKRGEMFTDLLTLARLELLTWGENHSMFITFKNPFPGGYQGVWGEF